MSGGPQTLPLAEHHPKGDKNYNGCDQCSNYRGDDAPYAVCETEQVKEYAMSNERGEGCDNHDKDKKHVPIWKISEVLTGIIRELSNASWSECDDECA